ncbi:MAG: DUF4242 domain-containing protein [Gammaproteobacteria bacterium]|nr:DUF4242 domain-containing protein [Gammaproteobacteria bacterium]
MALFIIERNWAEELDVDTETVNALVEINEDCSVKWLTSFLSADKRKTYCLYEASNPEDLREAARRANIPADVIVELSSEIKPEAFV